MVLKPIGWVDRTARALVMLSRAPSRVTSAGMAAPSGSRGPKALWVVLAGAALCAGIGFWVLAGRTSTPPALLGPRGPASAAEVDRFLAGWAERDGETIDAASGFPRTVRRKADGMRMALIPAGDFWMGSSEKEPLSRSDERPRHRITLARPYYLDESEVTVGMWQRFAASSGTKVPDLRYSGEGGIPKGGLQPEHPISGVALGDVLAYLAWAKVTLPTEAQWERAARGGSDDRVYPWGNEDDVAKRSGLDVLELRPVKTFAPNPFGLYDMSGNVAEWCADGYDPGWYAKSPAVDPLAPVSESRVVRGGSYGNDYRRFRCAARWSFGPGGFSLDPPFTAADLEKLLPAGGTTVSSLNVGFRGARTTP
jgi:sulfatase modifying factor 1